METDKLIYWAGFFDGQGHVELAYVKPTTARPRGRYSFQLWINKWARDPHTLFADLTSNFGGRVIPSDGSLPYNTRWYISGSTGRHFLESILPYLRVKKRVAELGIELQKRMERNGNKVLTATEIETRDRILEEYFSLIPGNKPSRIKKLGADFL